MNKNDSLWKLLCDTFRSNRQRKQQERVEDAVKAHAELVGEGHVQKIMAEFYTNRVATIDHTQHWWAYAQAKQKEHEHVQECIALVAKADEAAARIDAEIARAEALDEDMP
jgi:hypothetical protein